MGWGLLTTLLTPCRRAGAVLWAPHCQPLPRHRLRWVLGLCHRRKCSSPSCLWAASWVSRLGGAGGCARGPHNPILPRPRPPVQERGPGWCWPGWGGFAFPCSIHTKRFAEEVVAAGVRLSQNAFHKRCQGRCGMAQGPQGVPQGPFLGAASPSQGNSGTWGELHMPPRGCGTPCLGHPWCWGAKRERGRSAAQGKCPRGWVLCLPPRSPR